MTIENLETLAILDQLPRKFPPEDYSMHTCFIVLVILKVCFMFTIIVFIF